MALFDSEKQFREYAQDQTTSALYLSGLERDYIVTYAGGELPRMVTHEFVHFLLNQTPAPLPHWFGGKRGHLLVFARLLALRKLGGVPFFPQAYFYSSG